MNQRDILRQVITKYKLDKPIPVKAQKEMLTARKDTLIEILKRNKKYSIFLFSVISLFFWIKRFGLSLSILKSAIITIP